MLSHSNRSASGMIWAFPAGQYGGLWALARTDGYSPVSHIWLETPCDVSDHYPDRFTGSPGESFYLWNTAIERSIPVLVRLHRASICLFEVIPEKPMRAGDTYVLVVRDVLNRSGNPVVLSHLFDKGADYETLLSERLVPMPSNFRKFGVQTILHITIRSYENMIGQFLHLRNSILAWTDPDDVPVSITEILQNPGQLIVHGTAQLPTICERDLFGHCRITPSDTGRIEYNRSTITRDFFVRIPETTARRGLFIPAMVYQEPETLIQLNGVARLLDDTGSAAFGFRDQKNFLSLNRKPVYDLPSPLPGYILDQANHDRLTAMPDREAVRVLHGILLSRLMQSRIPALISGRVKRPLRIDKIEGLALEADRDAFALSVNPFLSGDVLLFADDEPRGLPFGPGGTIAEKEYVRLYWDGMHFPNYAPLIEGRGTMPDTPRRKTLVVRSILIEEERKKVVRFLNG
ncbi:MAG TPA: hypothetical protein PLD60_10785, partial [Leptospiraceae bacterium]|nr:hypothetical protein [Leptospiraceae bacterium]